MSEVTDQSIVVALLGASSGLAGLVLVFLGIVVGSVSTFAPGTKKSIVNAARRPAIAVLISFGIGIACVAAATGWLLADGAGWLFVMTVGLFALQLISLVVAVGWTVRQSVWG